MKYFVLLNYVNMNQEDMQGFCIVDFDTITKFSNLVTKYFATFNELHAEIRSVYLNFESKEDLLDNIKIQEINDNEINVVNKFFYNVNLGVNILDLIDVIQEVIKE